MAQCEDSELKRSSEQPYLVPVVFDKTESVHRMECDQAFACIVADGPRAELEAALQALKLEVCYSSDGRHIPDHVPDECDMVFVCENFDGEAFEYLQSRKFRTVGPPCVLYCAKQRKPLPNSVRPVYCNVMEGVVVCFTGFKDKDKDNLKELCNLAHLMGASVRKDISGSVTHVVAHSVSGSRYKSAVGLGTPILSEEWMYKCWENKDNSDARATGDELMMYKQLPFAGCQIALHGFSDEESQHMREIATDNGAVNGLVGEDGVTHLVVADGVGPETVPVTHPRVLVVKQQWFWESIQIEASADEGLYSIKSSSSHHHRHHRKSRRRTSLNSTIDLNLLEASLFSLSSPATAKGIGKQDTPRPPTSGSSSQDTARKHIASELLSTEKNFVEILRIVITVFKEPLGMPQQRGGPILTNEDIKSIFANIPEILAVHQKLVASLGEQIAQWCDATCIGSVLLDQAAELLRVYPPFVNFYEMSQEALTHCDKTVPRFHAFLKVNESRPECSRQTLGELLITPVQRIPRIILLLQDLLKHTDSSHPDHTPLQSAVESLKHVMNHINEDKRKTESQMQMFEVLRDVEGCPATVLSSNRSFVRRLEVQDIGNPSKGLKGGDSVVMFVFTDSVELAKRKPVSGFSIKSSTKTCKHLEFLPYIHIRSIVNFGEGAGFNNAFGMFVRWPEDPQEKLLVFRLVTEDVAKEEIVQQLAKLLANSNFSTDPDRFLMTCSGSTLSSVGKPTTLKRALHGASKRVKRAFSGRSIKKGLTSTSVHQSLHGIGEENVMPDMPAECMTSPNSSVSSSTPTLTCTPVASLRTPRAKRPALGYTPSFSAADLTNL